MRPFIFGLTGENSQSAMQNSIEALQAVGGNTGNLAFGYAIGRQVEGVQQSVLWHAPHAKIMECGDIGILTLANQLGPHADFGYLAKHFSQLSVPLVGIGLGAQSDIQGSIPGVPEGTLSWIREIQRRSAFGAANVGVRGEFTLEVLDRYGLAERAVVTGCPTLFISPNRSLGASIAERFRSAGLGRVAVAAGHHGWAHLARLERSLVAIATLSGGDYIVQSPIELVTLAREGASCLPEVVCARLNEYILPSAGAREFDSWAARHARVFFSAPAWMEFLRKFDFVVGARIHGVMLALQAGIPGLCIAHDSRTLELCQLMKVPHVAASEVSGGLGRSELEALFDFDSEEFDVNRSMLARRYVDFLVANGLGVSDYMHSLAQV